MVEVDVDVVVELVIGAAVDLFMMLDLGIFLGRSVPECGAVVVAGPMGLKLVCMILCHDESKLSPLCRCGTLFT